MLVNLQPIKIITEIRICIKKRKRETDRQTDTNTQNLDRHTHIQTHIEDSQMIIGRKQRKLGPLIHLLM